ncbi:MAG: arginine--tRNA ligase [Spirochaetales bacterium]|nr:arginine--tRNA ligase [Spirochaetales bacterium]
MDLITRQLEDLFLKAVQKVFPDASCAAAVVQFTKDPGLGDVQCNSAMALAREVKDSPRNIAGKIAAAAQELDGIRPLKLISSLEIAGPGFINMRLDHQAVWKYLADQNEGRVYPSVENEGPVVIDYSAPNIAKRMHIGHLRSTIIGDSLKRIYRHLGYTVVADNHVGDWGTQFGKLIVGYHRWLDKTAYAESPIEELERIYVKFEQESVNDETLLSEARNELKKLQDGDEQNTALWHEFIDSSMREYEKIYSRLGITFDTHRGESFYHDMMSGVIADLKEKELLAESDGALVVFFADDEHLHPCIVRKQDGAYLYATSDLACIKRRIDEYHPRKIIYVTDDRQITHFKQVFNIAERLGWTVEREHVYFGVMKFTDGHFSSRKGNVIYLSHLLDEAEKRAFEIVTEKNPALPEEERKDIARVVGTGAVKYFDLSQNRTSNIIFEWDKVLSFEGNTSPYLQYVYARIQSVLKKAGVNGELPPPSETEFTEGEQKLVHSLLQFSSAVVQAAASYKPNVIADYIYDLSQSFNSFYNSHPILKEEETKRDFRLYLCSETARVIKNGLELLGIEVLERM